VVAIGEGVTRHVQVGVALPDLSNMDCGQAHPAKKSNRLWGAIDGMLVEYVVCIRMEWFSCRIIFPMKKVQRFLCGSHSALVHRGGLTAKPCCC